MTTKFKQHMAKIPTGDTAQLFLEIFVFYIGEQGSRGICIKTLDTSARNVHIQVECEHHCPQTPNEFAAWGRRGELVL